MRRIRPRVVAAFAVASAGLVAAVWLPTRNDIASAAEQPTALAEQPTALADDFDGASGASLDANRWLLVSLPTANQAEVGGVLDGAGHLTVGRPLIGKVPFVTRFGHAEARLEVSRAAGAWRAFAVVDPSGGVLGGDLSTPDGAIDPTSGAAFHTYAIDWSPQRILWSIDGQPSLQLVPKTTPSALFVMLNVAASGTGPGHMVIDYVHVSASAEPAPAPSTPTQPPATPTSPAKPTATPPATAKPTVKPTAPVKPAPKPAPKPTTKPAPKPAAWKPFTNYAAGALVTYQGVTYRVKQAHTSLPGWQPSALPALFTKA